MRLCCLLFFLLAFNTTTVAQGDVGGGLQVDFPMMFNGKVGGYHHSLGAVGPRFNFKYYPRTTIFYPSFTANATGIRLPVVKQGNSVVSMLFTQVNIVLGANIRKVFENRRELHYGLGIGGSYFDGYGLEVSDEITNATTLVSDTGSHITRWVPAVFPSIEYIFPISQEKPLFVGIGGQLQYVYFFDDGSVNTVQLIDGQGQYLKLKAALSGHMINPGVHLSVYYRFGNTVDY